MVGERIKAGVTRITTIPTNAMKTFEELRPANKGTTLTGTVINTGKRFGTANRQLYSKVLSG